MVIMVGHWLKYLIKIKILHNCDLKQRNKSLTTLSVTHSLFVQNKLQEGAQHGQSPALLLCIQQEGT